MAVDGCSFIISPLFLLLLDQWIGSLNEDQFQAQLPLLRRTFAQFSPAERRKMGEMARREPAKQEARGKEIRIDTDRAKRVLPVLLADFGFNSHFSYGN
jgi:hypothetical protein